MRQSIFLYNFTVISVVILIVILIKAAVKQGGLTKGSIVEFTYQCVSFRMSEKLLLEVDNAVGILYQQYYVPGPAMAFYG